jgi:hypothetical protein
VGLKFLRKVGQLGKSQKRRILMKRRIARTGLVIMFAATVVASVAAPAWADDHHRCSLGSAAGNWAFTDSGAVIGVGPRTAVGILTFDRAGNVLNGVGTSSLNGNVADETFSGTYTVNPNCTGTISVEIFSSGVEILVVTGNLAFDDNMDQLRGIFTSVTEEPSGTPLSTVIALEGRRQSDSVPK